MEHLVQIRRLAVQDQTHAVLSGLAHPGIKMPGLYTGRQGDVIWELQALTVRLKTQVSFQNSGIIAGNSVPRLVSPHMKKSLPSSFLHREEDGRVLFVLLITAWGFHSDTDQYTSH